MCMNYNQYLLEENTFKIPESLQILLIQAVGCMVAARTRPAHGYRHHTSLICLSISEFAHLSMGIGRGSSDSSVLHDERHALQVVVGELLLKSNGVTSLPLLVKEIGYF
jgi:hypothetical protein